LFIHVLTLAAFAGVRNDVRGDLHTNVTLLPVVADVKYTALGPQAVDATNVDVFWPKMFALVPELYPLAGMNATLDGGTGVGRTLFVALINYALYLRRAANMLDGVSFYIRGLPATNITLHNATQYNATAQFFPPANFSLTGYSNLTVVNPDGGRLTAIDAMFFTEDCPFIGACNSLSRLRFLNRFAAGFVGYGQNCRSCPSGAYCPGTSVPCLCIRLAHSLACRW
jgi:hypothetical protein